LDIVDAQVHLPEFPLIPEQPAIATAVTTMDALGIAGLVIDEVFKGRIDPHGYPLPNGATRVNHDFSKKAVREFPHRFAYLFHVDPLDPDLDNVMAEASRDPAMVGLRVTPTTYPNGAALWREGAWDAVFRPAQKYGVAAFCFMPTGLDGFRDAATKFPDMLFVLDHTGMGRTPGGNPPDRSSSNPLPISRPHQISRSSGRMRRAWEERASTIPSPPQSNSCNGRWMPLGASASCGRVTTHAHACTTPGPRN